MDLKVLKIINDKQLTSSFNKTKWQKLINVLCDFDDFEPEVRYKTIHDEIYGFSHVWWNELYEICSYVYWLDIDPIKRERRGALLQEKTTDYSQCLLEKLKLNHIPFSIKDRYFRIWGYVGRNDRPVFNEQRGGM